MPQFQLATPDLLLVAVYVVFIVGLSFYCARRTETTDDYFLAGRSLTWWLIAVRHHSCRSRLDKRAVSV